MQYMLMLYFDEAGFQKADKASLERIHGAYNAYTEAAKTAGVLVGGDRLHPSTTASTVRLKNGKSAVLDGPYAETKEQFGGYYLINVPDLDAALDWAARCPTADHGTVEVRAIWAM
jgi:hypothetical protein